jgi:hypothetical protein
MRTAKPAPTIPQTPELGDRLGAAVSFATTEHFTLQTARSTTVAEASSRATGYFAVLSSTLIALAFVGNMSGLSDAFYLFSSLLLPVLAFIGVVTFGRLVQSTNEDIAYAQRIARLRSLYVDVVPELEPYLTVITVDSATESLSEEREPTSKSQLFLTVAGMIAVINSVVIGTTCGLFAGIVSSNPTIASPIAGLTGAGTSLVVHLAHQLRVLRRRDGMVVDEFAIAVPSHTVDKEGEHGPRL